MSAARCALHASGRCALGVMALSSTRRCSPFPEKKYARCVGGKERGVGELRVHCADRQDRERKRSETLPVACNIIVTIGVRGRVSAKALRGIGLVAMQCAPNTCSIHCMMHRKLRMLRRKTYTRVARPVCDVRSFGIICFSSAPTKFVLCVLNLSVSCESLFLKNPRFYPFVTVILPDVR
jgi:hypothetical protein